MSIPSIAFAGYRLVVESVRIVTLNEIDGTPRGRRLTIATDLVNLPAISCDLEERVAASIFDTIATHHPGKLIDTGDGILVSCDGLVGAMPLAYGGSSLTLFYNDRGQYPLQFKSFAEADGFRHRLFGDPLVTVDNRH